MSGQDQDKVVSLDSKWKVLGLYLYCHQRSVRLRRQFTNKEWQNFAAAASAAACMRALLDGSPIFRGIVTDGVHSGYVGNDFILNLPLFC